MLSRAITPKRRGRRPLGGIAVLAVITGMLVVTGTALAVHDEVFQLDGDTAASTQTNVGGTQTVDWDSIFTATGADQAVLPANFSGTAFKRDFIQNANGSFNTSDPTTFATGSKDTLPITPGWQCNTDSNVNSKTDVMNAYAVEYDAGDDIMYFALERNANTGDGNVGFWFLQDPAVGCVSGGGTTAFTGDHADGDLLVVSEFTNGGSVSTVQAYVWVGGANGALNPDPVAEGVNCVGNAGNDDVCAQVNTGTLNNIPWLTANKQDGVGHSLRVSEFFEGGVNLTALDLSDKCFNTFMGVTRSSTSLTATLFDYALGQTGSCTSTTVTTPKKGDGTAIPAGGLDIPGDPADAALLVQDDATLTVTGIDTFSGTLSFHLCGPTAANSTATCDTGGVAVSSQTVTTAGTYSSTDATVTAAGRYCWRADFSGDEDAGVPPSSDHSAGECFIVNPRAAALVTTATVGPVAFGQPISDVVTLSNTAHKPGTGGPAGSALDGSINPTTLGGDATGNIVVKAFGPDSCTTVAFTSTAINASGNGNYGGPGTAFQFTPTAPGQYIFVASYAGDSPNTSAVTEGTCASAPAAEKVTVQQIATTISTTQRAYPNDSATVAAATGNLPGGGTVQFRLFDSLANCQAGDNAQTVGQNGLLYKESEDVTGGANTETETTSNTSVAVSTNTTVYWLVTYATGDTAHTGRKSDCSESTAFTFVNDAGPGTLFP